VRRPRAGSAWTAAAAYLLLAILATWPLAANVASKLPWDLGDSLLNLWILGWVAEHLSRFLGGDLSALHGFWNGNFFYPEPLVLAYSEHLFAQAVQILPVYVLTGNLVLCYNLLFISTFVLSGLGMFLLVRDVTGRAAAGLVAGLIFGFAPYRIAQFSHLQVLSAQWMPFALYGIRRYFATRRTGPLIGGAAALVAQNLSCGYFLIFFAPFFVVFVLYEMASRRLLADARVWLALAATGAAVVALTVPFLLPYLALKSHGTGARPISEVQTYSADVYAYLTAHGGNRLWGPRLQVFLKPEGELFPSFTAMALAASALVGYFVSGWRASRNDRPAGSRARRVALWALCAIAGIHLAAFLMILGGKGGLLWIGPIEISIKRLWRVLAIAAAASAGVLGLSARARTIARGDGSLAVPFAAATLVVAVFLSFGPAITSMGRHVATGPYLFLHEFVPGFDSLRVPARMSMIVLLFLSMLAGWGVVFLLTSTRRTALVAGIASACFLAESTAAPLPMNTTAPEATLRQPPAFVGTGSSIPPVYAYLRTLPPDAVIAHLPFGSEAYELRYVYYSTAHWHRLLNGYSGHFPESYWRRYGPLSRVLEDPGEAWTALLASNAAFLVIHKDAFRDGDGERVSRDLQALGARPVVSFGADDVLKMPGR
jgi:hypothetical protein